MIESKRICVLLKCVFEREHACVIERVCLYVLCEKLCVSVSECVCDGIMWKGLWVRLD